MAKAHVKRGDEVVVISGTERGKRGKVIRVYGDRQRVIVEGIKMIKRHTRKNAQHPQGAIVEREGTVHLSNVMLAQKYDARAAKRSGSAEPASA
jgi:large subunit ribosomal protein L24